MTDAMPNKNEIRELFDATAYDRSGDKLGSVNEVFLDDRSGQPKFVEVNHGLFGLSSSLVPLRGSSLSAGSLNLGFSKDAVKDAPDIDADNGLTAHEEDRVYAHYGLSEAQDADYFHLDGTHADAPLTQTDPTSRRDADLAADAQDPPRDQAPGHAHKEADFNIVSETSPSNAANSGVGGGAPGGAVRSDADTTVASEPAVADDNERYPADGPGDHTRGDVVEGKTPGDFERADSAGKHARGDVVEGKAPGDFDTPDNKLHRFPLRKFSDRQTGTVK
ncbi:PRC-barrel domain protein [Corynebacterium faecale]|uniref:PRC-barrel domain-containing protein n=1 Tax=Corynebacterium faecale TaxID=1758466 RepID=UPI0025B51084|nr:PRC-barrel domain-containing protein [Corynebacterium faecale]WJY92740.1 PRC-barrel domain protein [Corynebacterium faecale]